MSKGTYKKYFKLDGKSGNPFLLVVQFQMQNYISLFYIYIKLEPCKDMLE